VKNQQTADVLRDLSPARIFARPTADDLWLGPTQASALSHLSPRVPVRVLLGPASSGRTTLLRRLARRSEADGVTLRVAGPERLRARVLKSLLHSAGLQSDGLDRDEMRRLIDVFIRESLARGRRVVIEVDDADTLGPMAFGEIARLKALASRDRPGPEILLSLVHIDEASSAAAEFVRAEPAPALVVLSWLNASEVSWYLHWRLERFGLAGLVTPGAMRLISRCTRGCFASVDHICQMALLLLRNRAAEHIDVMVVREAMRSLQRQRELKLSGLDTPADAELTVSCNGTVVRELKVGERLMIGRSHFNDLCLESSYLSRHHLTITRGETGYYLSDLNSVNGVTLNGQRVHSAPIGDGDVLSLGPYRIKVALRDDIPRVVGRSEVAELAETAVMPAPGKPEPAHLKVVK
jgi:hypothetical protein